MLKSFSTAKEDGMFSKRVIYKFFDFLILFPVFFTPLLFFILSHDQFELPKLTFLALLTLPALVSGLKQGENLSFTPLSLALGVLLTIEIAASLPATSLSWRTSLLGDYENFAGLSTFILYLIWFRFFSRHLNREKIEKLFFFNSLAALLSSLYAIGQHFGFDFIQWNKDSIIATREFASLGNPNFLSAYLAMSLPLFLSISVKPTSQQPKPATSPSLLFWVLGAAGLLFLVLGTPKAGNFLHLMPSTTFQLLMRSIGLCFFSISGLRFLLVPSWLSSCGGTILIILGLLTTGSRGGFLGAVLGIVFWLFLSLRNPEFPYHRWISKIPRVVSLVVTITAGTLFYLVGHGFLNRLWDSTIHIGQSLAVSRLHIWGPGVKMAEAKPVLGVGLDNFKIAFPYYSGIGYNEIDGMFNSSRMAHNELLQMACTTGFLGLAAYLGVLGAFIFMGWKCYGAASGPVKGLLAAVFSAALAYQVQNFFSFGVASINLLWFLLLAVVQWNYRSLTAPETPVSGSRSLVLVEKPVLILLLSVISWFPLNRLGADIAFGFGSAAAEALKQPDPGTSPETYLSYSNYEIELMERAVKLCPLETKYVLYLGLAYEQRAQLDSTRSKDFELLALASYEKAIEMSPFNAYYYNDRGRVCDALSSPDNDDAAKAAESYGEAVHWNPSSPFFNINWAIALQKTGKGKEAEAPMEKAFQLDPAFAAKVLAQMAFEKYKAGDKPKAFEILADALQRNPSSAEAYYCRGILYLEEKKKGLALKDLEAAKALNPTREKNPSIQGLDELVEQARK